MTPAFQDSAVNILARPLLLVLLGSLLMFAWGIGLRLRTMRRNQRWAYLEALWTPALLAVLSGDANAETLHALVLPGNRLRFAKFLTRYVRRFSGEERLLLYRIAAPYLAPVAARARRGTPERRAYALQTLSALGLSGYSDVVMQALDDPSVMVAMVAAQELARSSNAEYAPAILSRLSRFENWSSRYLASLLAGMGRHAAPALRAKLADQNELPRARSIAANALHLLKDASSAPLAEEICQTESDRDLVIAALALIGDLGRPEHLEIVRSLSWSSDFVIRAQALETLGRVGERDDIDRLSLGLEDENPWVALRAATALRRLGCVDVLMKFAESESPRALVAREAVWNAQ